MSSTSSVRRFNYLVDPNEGLITTGSMLEYIERLAAFREDTEIPDEHIVATPVVGVPLPVTMFDGNVRVRPRVHPVMMWHPLFWLPKEIGLRRVIPGAPDIDEEDRQETDEEWAIRVALQCAAAGLFEPVGGTWIDIAAYAGVDIDSDEDLARIQAWLDGGADSDLDVIDLTQFFAEADAEAVAENALAASAEFIGAQYALTAVDVYRAIEELLNTQDVVDTPDALDGAFRLWSELAGIGFSGSPSTERYEDVRGTLGNLIEQHDIQQSLGEADPRQLLGELQSICESMYETYSPFLETVAGAAAPLAEDAAAADEPAQEPAGSAQSPVGEPAEGSAPDTAPAPVAAFDAQAWASGDAWDLDAGSPRHG